MRPCHAGHPRAEALFPTGENRGIDIQSLECSRLSHFELIRPNFLKDRLEGVLSTEADTDSALLGERCSKDSVKIAGLSTIMKCVASGTAATSYVFRAGAADILCRRALRKGKPFARSR